MVIGVCKQNIRPASLTPLCVVPWSACLVRLTVQWQFWRSRGSVDDEVNSSCLLRGENKIFQKDTQIPGILLTLSRKTSKMSLSRHRPHIFPFPLPHVDHVSGAQCDGIAARSDLPFQPQSKVRDSHASQQMQKLPTTWRPCKESKWC